MSQPLAIDLFCGLGGWTEGLLAEGYRVIGFDIERHAYGDQKYPAQLVIQDVLTIHGSRFKNAALIVASPPCQAYSYRAMPWKRAKALPPPDNSLFEASFRIQKEAIEAAGHFIPLVVENVRGAQPWVGRAKWHHGSFYLWGDIPTLMPIARRASKNTGGSWFSVAHNKGGGHSKNPKDVAEEAIRAGIKQAGIGGIRKNGKGDAWFQDGAARHGSKSTARKAASAQIAKIPITLSRHIAAYYKPEGTE